jgi:hypothetical protein
MDHPIATDRPLAVAPATALRNLVRGFPYPISPLYLWLFIASVLVALFLSAYYRPKLSVPIAGDIRTFQIYRFTPASGYSERNSSFFLSRLDISLTGLYRELRFPAADRFRLEFIGNGSVRLDGKIVRIDNFLLQHRLTTYVLGSDKIAVHGMTASGFWYSFHGADHPHIDISLDSLDVSHTETSIVFTPLLVVVLIFGSTLVLWRIRYRIAQRATILLAMVAICTFLGMMALTLPYDHGPDEALHCLSGIWYLDNDRPPSIDDAIFYHPYWGVNYLIGSPDLTYWVTFHAASALNYMSGFDVFREARLAQIAIVFGGFVVVLAYADRHFAWSYLLSLLVLPQLAYASTYVNGDVLSFFLAFIAFALLVSKVYLPWMAISSLFFVVAGLKLNYYVLVPVAFYLVYARYGRKALPAALGGFLLGSYKIVFTLVDCHAIGRSLLANQILHATNPEFKARLLHPYVQWSVLSDEKFYQMTLKSLYGVFGYLSYPLPWFYYCVGVLLFCILVAKNAWRNNFLFAGVLTLNMAASLFFSSTYAYQAQGRYLFPAIVMLFVVSAPRVTSRVYAVFAIPTIFAIFSFWRDTVGI